MNPQKILRAQFPQYNDYKDVPPTQFEFIDKPKNIPSQLIQNGLVPEDKTT